MSTRERPHHKVQCWWMRHATAEPPDSRNGGARGESRRTRVKDQGGHGSGLLRRRMWSRATKVLTYESCSAWPVSAIAWGRHFLGVGGQGEGGYTCGHERRALAQKGIRGTPELKGWFSLAGSAVRHETTSCVQAHLCSRLRLIVRVLVRTRRLGASGLDAWSRSTSSMCVS